jgi:hypothetical protein
LPRIQPRIWGIYVPTLGKMPTYSKKGNSGN